MGSISDPIGDLLTRIRNGSKARHRFVDISWSRLKENVVRILHEQGYIAHYLVREEDKKKSMRIFLKYGAERSAVIQGLKRVSKPSLRQYVDCKSIPVVLGGMGIAIVSTPKGVLVGAKAREEKVGGELLCLAW